MPTKWTARIRKSDTGEPKRVNVRDLKLKNPAEDWELKPEDIGRGAKFVNSPRNLPDIDWTIESDNDNPGNDNSNSPDKNNDTPTNQTDKTKKYSLRKNIKPPNRLDL